MTVSLKPLILSGDVSDMSMATSKKNKNVQHQKLIDKCIPPSERRSHHNSRTTWNLQRVTCWAFLALVSASWKVEMPNSVSTWNVLYVKWLKIKDVHQELIINSTQNDSMLLPKHTQVYMVKSSTIVAPFRSWVSNPQGHLD